MNNEVIKKTDKDSFFKTVKVGNSRYNSESLEINGHDVLQVMKLNDNFVVIEYGTYKEEITWN